MKNRPTPLFRRFFIFFIATIFLIAACSDKKANELYELAEFEELQMNYPHAEELYNEIVQNYPQSDIASKALAKLKSLEKKKAAMLTEINTLPSGGNQMTDNTKKNLSALDKPEILQFLFHPRPDYGVTKDTEITKNIQIPVEKEVVIGSKFHHAGHKNPTILFFHGNGEIASDYDDLAPFYLKMGINFFAVDYRGYGASTGSPSVKDMIDDSHKIFKFVKDYLKKNNYEGPLVIMGRSLGSASALELVSSYGDEINGLIIESGFAHAIPLLKLLGVNPGALTISEEEGFDHLSKIKTFVKPTLIIHAEGDHIIPFSDGKALYESSPAEQKFFLNIPGANHNTILSVGLSNYMDEVKKLTGLL